MKNEHGCGLNEKPRKIMKMKKKRRVYTKKKEVK